MRRQSLVTTMTRELSSSLEVETVLETTANRFAELLDIAGCVVYRLDGEELVCVVSVEDGARLHDRAGRRVSLAERCADRTAVETRAPVVVDSSDDPRLSALEREAMRRCDERAALIVPMIARDSVIGTIELTQTHRERVFSADEVATAEAIAGVVALALQNAELYRDQTERTQRLASLLEASRAISSSLVVDEVLDTLVRRAAETLRADISMLFAYDAASDTITPRALFERTPTPYEDMGKPRALSGYPQGREILEGGEVSLECISDPQLDPESRVSMEEWNEKSCLSVPLSFHAEPMGILVITDTVAERRYSAEELELVKALGEQAAVALHNAQQFETLERHSGALAERARREALVNSTSLELSSSLEVEKVLETTARRFEELIGASAGCDLYRIEGDELVCVASVMGGVHCGEWSGKRVSLADWRTDRLAIETRAPVIVDSIDDPRLSAVEREAMRGWDEGAVLVLPMIRRDVVTGVIELATKQGDRGFSLDDAATAEALARVAALAIENAELYRDQARRTQRLTSMLDAGKAITSSLVLDEVLGTVARQAAAALGCPECIIYDYDADEDTLVARALHQVAPTPYNDLGVPIPLNDWPADRRLLEGHKIVAEMLSDQTLDPEVRASMESWGEKTCLNVPLYFGEQPLGILVLIETQRERDFTADDIELAAGLGEQAAIAIHNARLAERLRLRTEEATLLNDVARAASTSLSVTDIAAAIIEPLRQRIPFDRATLLLRRSGSAAFDVAFSTEAASQVSGITIADLEVGFLARLSESSVALLSLPEQMPLAAGHPITGLRCGAVVGIHEDEELIGALVLGSESEAAYSEGDVAVLDGIAAQLSLAVCNARLYENVRRMHLGNVRALSAALTAKDNYTIGHTARVACYAVLLASELGWSHTAIEELEEVAYLHDIGKIAVSDRVLLKAGPLTSEEWELMRQHPAVSAEIIEPLLEPRLVGGVRHHHERYDGTGYPDGLAGAQIPESARLLCVVDSYDAMSSRRVYKKALSYTECLAELERCKGTQFDPALVDAFVRVLARMEIDRRFATQVASEAAACVDPAKHALLRKPADETRPEYAEICAALRAVRAAHPKVETVLTEVLVDERRCMVVVDSTEDPAIRSPIGELQLADDEELEMFCGRTCDANVVYVDAWGAWVCGIAPLRDETAASSPSFRPTSPRPTRPTCHAPRARSARPSRGSCTRRRNV